MFRAGRPAWHANLGRRNAVVGPLFAAGRADTSRRGSLSCDAALRATPPHDGGGSRRATAASEYLLSSRRLGEPVGGRRPSLVRGRSLRGRSDELVRGRSLRALTGTRTSGPRAIRRTRTRTITRGRPTNSTWTITARAIRRLVRGRSLRDAAGTRTSGTRAIRRTRTRTITTGAAGTGPAERGRSDELVRGRSRRAPVRGRSLRRATDELVRGRSYASYPCGERPNQADHHRPRWATAGQLFVVVRLWPGRPTARGPSTRGHWTEACESP